MFSYSEQVEESVGQAVRTLANRRHVLSDQIAAHTKAKSQAEHEAEVITGAMNVLQAVAEAKREMLRERVEAIVDSAVRGIFGPRMAFRLRAELSRNQMAVYPEIGKRIGDQWVWDEVSQCGGGVHDVVSFVMRVVVLSLYSPHRAKTLVVDEPFRHVSRVHLPLAADMVRKLADVANLQFFIITHKPEVVDVADRAYEIVMDSQGISTATEMDNG